MGRLLPWPGSGPEVSGLGQAPAGHPVAAWSLRPAAGSAAAAGPSACATSVRTSGTWWWGSTPRPSAPPALSPWEAVAAASSALA